MGCRFLRATLRSRGGRLRLPLHRPQLRGTLCRVALNGTVVRRRTGGGGGFSPVNWVKQKEKNPRVYPCCVSPSSANVVLILSLLLFYMIVLS